MSSKRKNLDEVINVSNNDKNQCCISNDGNDCIDTSRIIRFRFRGKDIDIPIWLLFIIFGLGVLIGAWLW